MAGKEATVYILDLGETMGEKRHGRDMTDLEWALEYVWDKITTTVSTGRKTALMSVIGVRTDETELKGVMEEDEGYENITVFSDLKQYLLPDIRMLQDVLKPSSTSTGDLISALAVAIHQIDVATSGKNGNLLKYDRRIIIVTDGRGYMDTADLDAIAGKMKSYDPPMEVVLLGVDFDDPGSGYKEEDKDAHKEQNETVLKAFIDDCDGNFGSLAQAIEQLEIPRLKETRAVPSYKGTLTLGDTEAYDATITIDVERYPCTMVAKPPTASSFIVRTDLGGTAGPSTQSSATVVGDSEATDGQLSAVRNHRAYQVDNPDEPGQKMNVEPDDLERGFEYGRTAVHVSESDANVVKIETKQSLELIGFIAAEKFDRYLPMSRSNYIVPQKTNGQAKLALSSFINALWEAECYAIARLVTKENKAPLMVLLTPRIEPDYEALIEVELPFEEDMRRYKFPPLDKKLTVSGKTITEHKDLPNDDLVSAMSDYVDAMDLSTFGTDDDGNPAEYAPIEDTYSPLLHRVNQIIRWRATHSDPTLPLPNPPQILTRFSAPPSELLQQTESQLTALKTAADVKKVPPKTKGRGKRTRADREKPLSGLDIDELLGNPKRVKIEPSNLIPSFKQALAATDDLEAIQDAANAMAAEIRTLVKNSVGESGYGRALEAIRVFRDEITELEEPDMYNVFVRELKGELLDGKLGGDRREMWWRIRGSRYGLIDRKRCFTSDVSEEEAAAFYKG
ncbi:ATP-dependent DNA helicase-like protein II [Lentithecium fluviatile CBS 122367]|uniref:ATP-dependent DNA helicase II subunit 2 n=1 Tax=Lentithecium fluviatile CBS 122367 TaxID=1168545 RepID=A0A6G1J709_9PLEO|nr:ATP-dependent DNA helicase-like protein II [Lentithecium fluviatile CBS 122367]